MKILMFILICIMVLGLFSCSGDDPLDQDTDPPARPMLRPHLGDTGDPPVVWNYQTIELNDSNNGIDAVQDGNFIRIPWEPFIDTDVSHLNVFRFSEFEPTPVLVAGNVPASSRSYLDQSNTLVERVWYSYFIHLYDGSGNYSVSDTVSYAFLYKCNLEHPDEGSTVSQVNLKLQWTDYGVNASSFRVLIWNELDELLYTETINVHVPVDVYEIPFPNGLPVASGDLIRWRVDAFDQDADIEILMGSESQERTFYLE
ncbi:MAG: hypothetical protein CVU50_04675 [Candidatus Cloacimonetes bacterium HGW-Cloacimonetes-3]|jgi:hypothetical protein|nr:MAG: hypothetical protein CVU50_04675 [Candidatus Cloacimonetes bacterium HGW-Cloacimonetes-3]